MDQFAVEASRLKKKNHQLRHLDNTETFDELVTHWHHTRAISEAISPTTEGLEQALSQALLEQEETARAIMAMPALNVRQLIEKIKVLDHTLHVQHEAGQFYDCRDVMMTGAIKADLIQFAHSETSRYIPDQV